MAEGHDFRSTKSASFSRQVVHVLVNIVRFITEPIGQLWLQNFFGAQVNEGILKRDEVTTNRALTKFKKHLAACRWGFNLCLRCLEAELHQLARNRAITGCIPNSDH